MCSWHVAVPRSGPCGTAVDHHPARAADAFAAVVVERDRLLAVEHAAARSRCRASRGTTCRGSRRARRRSRTRPAASGPVWRQTVRVMRMRCAAHRATPLLVRTGRRVGVLELELLLVQLGLVADALELPRARRTLKFSSSRSASPSSVWYSSRKWPPQLSLRCSASSTISSPNSRKSATRPAFSSAWLRRLVLAEHAHVLPELLADRGDLARAPS